MHRIRVAPATVLLALLAVSILWKGGKSLDVVWLQALVAAFLIIITARRRKQELPVSRSFVLVLLLFSLCTIASFVLSATSNYGFDEVLQTISLSLIALYAAAEIQRNPALSHRVAKTVSIVTLLACSVGIIVYILQPVSRFSGTFFDYRFHTDYWPNAWADFILLAWPLLLWTLFLRTSRRMPEAFDRSWIKAAVLGLVLGCFFLSYSRGSFIAFAGQIVLLTIGAFFFRKWSFRTKALVTSVAVTALTSIVVFVGINFIRSQFHDVESVVKKATFSSAEGVSSATERAGFWKESITLASEKPLWGWGPYSFRFVQPHRQTEILATSDHAHNVFLKLASERGLPAALAFLLIIILALKPVIFTIVRTHRQHERLPLGFFFLLSVLGVIAHNLIDFNLQFVGIALPLWIMLGMMASEPGKKKSSMYPSFILMVAVVLCLFTLYEGMNLFLSSRARRAENNGQSSEALEWYARVQYDFFPRDAKLSQAAILLGLHQLPEAEDTVSQYLHDNAEDGRAWRLLGDIYLQWNKRFDALRAYEKAYTFARYNDAGILRGLVYLQEDVDRDALLDRRHEFDSLLNDYGLAINQNTHFIALSSSVEEVVSLCDLMGKFFPDDATLYHALSRRVMQHAQSERAKTAARPRGFIW